MTKEQLSEIKKKADCKKLIVQALGAMGEPDAIEDQIEGMARYQIAKDEWSALEHEYQKAFSEYIKTLTLGWKEANAK